LRPQAPLRRVQRHVHGHPRLLAWRGLEYAEDRRDADHARPLLLARVEGKATFKGFLGAEADLIRNVHGIAEVAGLDGDEVGFLLGRIAGIKGMK